MKYFRFASCHVKVNQWSGKRARHITRIWLLLWGFPPPSQPRVATVLCLLLSDLISYKIRVRTLNCGAEHRRVLIEVAEEHRCHACPSFLFDLVWSCEISASGSWVSGLDQWWDRTRMCVKTSASAFIFISGGSLDLQLYCIYYCDIIV